MKSSPEKSESLKKALGMPRPFDEAEYYQNNKVEMGGDDVMDEPEEFEETDDLDDDDDYEDHEYYGDDE
ncbi:MAG: hypothetical protein ACJ76H_13070 [Bacteriovoracaceae bacterium]